MTKCRDYRVWVQQRVPNLLCFQALINWVYGHLCRWAWPSSCWTGTRKGCPFTKCQLLELSQRYHTLQTMTLTG